MNARRRLLFTVVALTLAGAACSDADQPVEVEAPAASTPATATPDDSTPSSGAETTAIDGVAEVPYVVELDEEEAIAAIEATGLVAEVVPVWVPPTDPRLGKVITQAPEPFGWLPEGSTMQIGVGE